MTGERSPGDWCTPLTNYCEVWRSAWERPNYTQTRQTVEGNSVDGDAVPAPERRPTSAPWRTNASTPRKRRRLASTTPCERRAPDGHTNARLEQRGDHGFAYREVPRPSTSREGMRDAEAVPIDWLSQSPGFERHYK